MAIGGAKFGKTLFGDGLFGGKAPSGAASIVQDYYTLEVRSDDYTMLANLPNWVSGKWSQAANEPSKLEFTYPYTDEMIDLLVFPNQVVLRDRARTALDRCRIMAYDDNRDGADAETRLITCDGMLAQLGSEWIESLEWTAATTVKQIVADILAEQATTYYSGKILMGDIQASVATETRKPGKIENMTILQALLDLTANVGGFVWLSYPETSARPRLNWAREIGHQRGQQIRIEKNLQALGRHVSYRGLATEVVAYGQGVSPDTRLSATATNNTGTYGTIRKVISFPDVDNETHLQDLADAEVRRVSYPVTEYTCGVIDLSIEGGAADDYDHETLPLGQAVALIDTRMDVAFQTRIIAVERDLAAPLAVAIEVQNSVDAADSTAEVRRSQDFVDAVVDLLDARADVETRDTGVLAAVASHITDGGAIAEAIADWLAADDDFISDIADAIATDMSAETPSVGADALIDAVTDHRHLFGGTVEYGGA